VPGLSGATSSLGARHIGGTARLVTNNSGRLLSLLGLSPAMQKWDFAGPEDRCS